MDGSEKKKRRMDVPKEEKRKKPKYGSLFKKDKTQKDKKPKQKEVSSQPEEGSEEYWNQERAKLGLKPLKK